MIIERVEVAVLLWPFLMYDLRCTMYDFLIFDLGIFDLGIFDLGIFDLGIFDLRPCANRQGGLKT